MDEKRNLSNDIHAGPDNVVFEAFVDGNSFNCYVCGYRSARVCSKLLFSVFAKHFVLRSSDHQPLCRQMHACISTFRRV